MKNKKITKLSDLNQIDGRIHEENTESKPTRIDQIINSGSGISKYGTIDIQEYSDRLATMNTAELRTHALSKAGIVPSSNREKCIKQLIGKFKEYTSSYRRPDTDKDSNVRLPEKKLKAALDIMRNVK